MKSKTIVILCVCIMLFGGFRAIAQTASENAFKELASNLQLHSKTMSPYEYVDWAEKSLFDFIAKHPNAPEVAKAHFLLGRLYASVGAGDKAVKHFDTYLKSPNQGSPEENAQMKYVIAASYLTLDKYDEAEKLYRDLARPGSKIDRRISEAAASDLTRIATLRKLVVGAPALEISGVSHEGKRISLKNYRGKVILLDFWATWCSPCRTEMPNVVKTYGDFQKKGFEIIGISLDSDETQFRNFIKDNKMSWPQLYDGKGWANGIGQQYAVASIPATYLVDKKGKIRFKNVRGEELRQAVQKLIDEK